MTFFLPLTHWVAIKNPVTDCGCFGDALKLTPWESFTKDVVLLVLILIIFYGRKYIKPIFNSFMTNTIATLSLVLSLAFGYHVLMHLPTFDFRAYKIGNNILEEMNVPENAKKPVIEYTWTFNVNGEEKV